jgi:hypothetical protein
VPLEYGFFGPMSDHFHPILLQPITTAKYLSNIGTVVMEYSCHDANLIPTQNTSILDLGSSLASEGGRTRSLASLKKKLWAKKAYLLACPLPSGGWENLDAILRLEAKRTAREEAARRAVAQGHNMAPASMTRRAQ